MLDFDEVHKALKKSKITFKRFELIGLPHDNYKKQSAYRQGLHFMIQRSNEITLRNTYIDLREFKSQQNSKPCLKHLTIDKSWFYPGSDSCSAICLRSFKQDGDECDWPQNLTSLTQLKSLEKLLLSSPARRA